MLLLFFIGRIELEGKIRELAYITYTELSSCFCTYNTETSIKKKEVYNCLSYKPYIFGYFAACEKITTPNILL